MKLPSTPAFSILVELDPAADAHRHEPLAARRPGVHQDDALLQAILATPRGRDAPVVPLPGPGVPLPTGRRRGRALAVAAVTVLVVALGAWWLASGGRPPVASRAHRRAATSSPRSPHPPWRLASSQSPPPFQQGSGNPTSEVGITCVGGTTCYLSTGYGLDSAGGGSLYVSKDGGHTWSPSPLPDTDDAVTTSVSCASATWCAVGGGALDTSTGDPVAGKPLRDPVLLVTDDGGTTWTSEPVALPANVQDLPASGGLPAEATVWPGEVDAVSCSAPQVCNVLGQSQTAGLATELLFARTTDGGATWTTTVLPELPDEAGDQLPLDPGNAETMACPTAGRCVVVASPASALGDAVVDAWRTSDGGATWQESRLAGLRQVDPNLTCPTVEACWAGPASGAGGDPVLLRTTDGGSTWSQVAVGQVPRPGTVSGPLGYAGEGLGCTTASVCYLTATWGMDETTDAGSSWSLVPLPSTVGGVSRISCEPGGACAAIAYSAPPAPDQLGGGSLVITDAPAPEG